MEARTPRMTTATRSSIRVKPFLEFFALFIEFVIWRIRVQDAKKFSVSYYRPKIVFLTSELLDNPVNPLLITDPYFCI